MRRQSRNDVPSGPVRCAIYTRKSTEEGLEQEFNSLDAQKEACAAYVTSQRHEGWVLVPGDYDDGGFSGGTLERPALKRLLSEIAANRIDVIVVYKVDRLTRSLGDFSRIVDVLDEADASFVSVTQAFNTTTSMGRLTLNVLLSFAQFEREVTGERIRDKIAQSKARGMWMGGVVPLGYRVDARKLVVDEAEAQTVRDIMQRYLELGSIPALHEDLQRRSITGRARHVRGELLLPKFMSRGALSLLLSNQTYLGEIVHKGKSYPGEHDAIVAPALFDEVQARINENRNNHHAMAGVADPSLLAGILWDGHGRRMSPSHSVKARVKRYRYYVSRTDGPARDKSVWRVPAGDLEVVVTGRLRSLLLDEGQLLDALASPELDAVSTQTAMFEAKQIAHNIAVMASGDVRQSILKFVRRVEIHQREVRLEIDRDELHALSRSPHPEHDSGVLNLVVPATIARIGREMRLVVPPTREIHAVNKDPGLIKLIVKAHAARRAAEGQCDRSFGELAREHGYDRDYFGVLLRLSYLAPSLTLQILEGRQPPSLTRQLLARAVKVPMEWSAQCGQFEICSSGSFERR